MLTTDIGIFDFLIGFIVTIAIELVVAYFLKFRKRNELKVVALASVITYPVLHVLITFSAIIFGYYTTIGAHVMVLEIFVVLAEFCILVYVFKSKYSLKHLFMIAFVMNLASYIIGLFLF